MNLDGFVYGWTCCLKVSKGVFLVLYPTVGVEHNAHFTRQLACFLASGNIESRTAVGIDDGAAGVDDETTVGGHAIAAHFLEAATLCADARHEEEMVGSDFADVFKHTALSGTYHVHHIVGIAPRL